MFKTKRNRYVTKGVKEQIPKEIQMYCWQLIDKKVNEVEVTMDYLQILEFNVDNHRQSIEIVHRQEQPFFINYHEIKITETLVEFQIDKLWIIDDSFNQTMLLPEEY
ncbi:hypothetical protein A5819_000958 [Enterococcus sp. 7E2_DIV0204]|uniref:DUF960 family protein n=1 Tax=unclassified Enterococcus TaxID=2608891 RepID=UPI000A334E2D|nr:MULTISPECIES: DUF960 family protein [unclassified Enterococcus]OTN88477.1 hypothetical protein A5819_000958 [Enterococcus sp. 7E2_DIV0204]OTP50946.1 hypothetical protein A5884_000132 [Enterococcus sp. 7D2_DIV0200]